MYQITTTTDISGSAYNELIAYLTRHCDSFSFHLPNMGKMLVNERNAQYFPEYPIGYTEEIDQEKHRIYIGSVQPLINIISNDIIKQWKDTGYLDQISSIETEIFHALISPQTPIFFATAERILAWKYPKLPEDPCFFSNGICVFQCIAHESMCYFNSADPWILQFLKKHKIDFFINN
jgi:hypothetical protein